MYISVNSNRPVVWHHSVIRITGILVFMTLLALGAFVRVPLPFTPVPITLQTFFVLLAALTLRRNDAIAAILGYVCMGLSGWSLFAAGAGLWYLWGPTGGYLVGFFAAVYVMSACIRRNAEQMPFWYVVSVSLIASWVILLFGTLWLIVGLKMSLTHALLVGCVPFIVGDTIKAGMIALIAVRMQKRLRVLF